MDEKVTIYPGDLHGTIWAPTSKSSMQRACAAALLCGSVSEILNPGKSNDDKAALSIIGQLGADVQYREDNTIKIRPVSSFHKNEELEINCGESGLSVRMFTPVTSLFDQKISIYGSGSLLTRPMTGFAEMFDQLQIKYWSNDHKLPVEVQGPLIPKNIELDGSASSQYLTGLLLAYSAANAHDVSITVHNLKSKPYIDLTLEVMKAFHMSVPENRDYKSFYFKNDKKEHNDPIRYKVEGDWSGASFLLVAGAIAGDITVYGLDPASTQADKAVLLALKDCGANVEFTEDYISVSKGDLISFHFDATECPDLFPPLVALACYCKGTSVIKGIHRLTHKESNRALTLQEQFGQLGIDISFHEDTMKIEGKRPDGGVVHSCHDHRIAMACAVAALGASGPVSIDDPYAINKSYPDFYEDLRSLGASV